MKRLVCVLVLLSSLAASAQTNKPTSELEKLKATYQQTLTALGVDYSNKLTQLNEQYVTSLDKLMKKTMRAGDLDGALAVREEKNSIEQEPSKAMLDEIFGTKNWFCFPDTGNAIGVKHIPKNFVVRPPFLHADTGLGNFSSGQVVTSGISATIWMCGSLPRKDYPSFQERAIAEWVSKTNQPFTRQLIDSVVGTGNWACLDVPWAICVKHLAPNWPIQYPFVAGGYPIAGLGEVVPPQASNTILFLRDLPKDQCP